MGWDTSSRVMPPGWKATRKRIRQRDKDTCSVCGKHGTHVDHIIPHYLGGTDEDSNLHVLCEADHLAKSSAEGIAARKASGARPRPPRKQQREPEQHPGAYL